jgi:predicted NBD/HSP70 family sugar kinase
MADMMVAARGGDTEIRSFIERGLEQLGNDPANAAFVAALREIINGGDASLSADGLDRAQAGVLDAIHRIANSTGSNDR